jgi:hypothetical protein
MGLFDRLFGKKKPEEQIVSVEFTEEQYENDYEHKKQGLEVVLGEMYRIVGHAIIPFSVGGAVDMYYFTKHIPGTGFATMELLDPNGNGPKPNRLGTYELVAFTKETYNESDNSDAAFNTIERHICGIFTTIGFYSSQAVLNPNETCEIPTNEGENKCIIFDDYKPDGREFYVNSRKHHLLLCLEVFRSELEYARKNGSIQLLQLLKQAGHYPYSDLNRTPVV